MMMNNKILNVLVGIIKFTLRHTRNLVYPPICMHCNIIAEDDNEKFCIQCAKRLIPIQPEERCPYCFSSDFERAKEICCAECRMDPLPLTRIAAVFDYEGPAASIVRHLKYGGQFYLAKGCGAYMAYQFNELNWRLPDAIIPMPMPILRRLDRGYNQSLLIAESLGKILDRPVLDILKRKSTGFSQAGLNIKQRKELKSSAFSLRSRKPELFDKSLLLVDDVMTTGSSLRCCAETLAELYPTAIYGLTFCRTI